jgi:hypothetical protein
MTTWGWRSADGVREARGRAGEPDGSSRRDFLRGACGATAAATAAVWVAPKLTSVAYAGDGTGSIAPEPPLEEEGNPGNPGEPGTETTTTGAEDGTPETQGTGSSGGGMLPFTGADPRDLVVTGLGSIAAGATMLAASDRLPGPDDAQDVPSRG